MSRAISARRFGSGRSFDVLMCPKATAVVVPRPTSMMPQPTVAVPGSMPSIFIGESFQVVPYGLDIRVVIENLVQSLECVQGIACERHGLHREIAQERGCRDEGMGLKRRFDSLELRWFRKDGERIVLEGEIFRSCFDGEELERFFLIRRARKRHSADALEKKAERPGRDEFSAAFGQERLDFAYRAVLVVSCRLDEHRDIAGTIRLVRELFDLRAFLQFAASARDSAFDILFGHIHAMRLIDGEPQSEIRVRVAAAVACSHDDSAAVFRENSRALGIIDALMVFDSRPMRMS